MTDSLTMPREAGSRTSHPTRSDPQDAVRCLACPHSALSQPPHFRPTERSQKIGGGGAQKPTRDSRANPRSQGWLTQGHLNPPAMGPGAARWNVPCSEGRYCPAQTVPAGSGSELHSLEGQPPLPAPSAPSSPPSSQAQLESQALALVLQIPLPSPPTWFHSLSLGQGHSSVAARVTSIFGASSRSTPVCTVCGLCPFRS